MNVPIFVLRLVAQAFFLPSFYCLLESSTFFLKLSYKEIDTEIFQTADNLEGCEHRFLASSEHSQLFFYSSLSCITYSKWNRRMGSSLPCGPYVRDDTKGILTHGVVWEGLLWQRNKKNFSASLIFSRFTYNKYRIHKGKMEILEDVGINSWSTENKVAKSYS